jgi:hypothetical protein
MARTVDPSYQPCDRRLLGAFLLGLGKNEGQHLTRSTRAEKMREIGERQRIVRGPARNS